MAERSFVQALGDAADGVATTFREQRNFRIQLAIAVLVVAGAALLRFDSGRWVVLALTIGAVLGAELINTALEHAVDCASPQASAGARAAKHAGAGAVLLLSVMAIVVGAVLFGTALVPLAHRGP
ncbi:MAG: diacylglycerol kinase family protein [Candidatus Eremiobacteraeota bacterium]|nr:diacylglycerol kinase family protein [Candidatus Eremiobacteraeota bacterium]